MGLNSSDSSDLMLMPVRVFIFHISSIFGRYYCHLYPALSLFNPLSLGQYCYRIDFGMGKPIEPSIPFFRHINSPWVARQSTPKYSSRYAHCGKPELKETSLIVMFLLMYLTSHHEAIIAHITRYTNYWSNRWVWICNAPHACALFMLWPAFPNLEYSGYSPTSVGELLPTQATWAYVSFHCLFQWSLQRFHTLISSLSWDSAFSYIFISPIH